MKNAPVQIFTQAQKDALPEAEYVNQASRAVAGELGLKSR